MFGASSSLVTRLKVDGAKDAKNTLKDFGKSLKAQAGSITEVLKSGGGFLDATKLAVAGAGLAAVTAAFVGFAKVVNSSLAAFERYDSAMSRLEGTLRSLAAAGETTFSLGDYKEIAEDLRKSSVYSFAELAESGQILAKSARSAKVMAEAMKASADYSAATGKQLKDTSRWMQTIIEAPSKGTEKLRKAGIQITEDARKRLQYLEQSGQVEEARLEVLKEFNKYSSNALDIMKSTAGLNKRWARFLEDAKAAFGKGVYEGLNRPGVDIMRGIEDIDLSGLEELGNVLGSAALYTKEIIQLFEYFVDLLKAPAAPLLAFTAALDGMSKNQGFWKTFGEEMYEAIPGLEQAYEYLSGFSEPIKEAREEFSYFDQEVKEFQDRFQKGLETGNWGLEDRLAFAGTNMEQHTKALTDLQRERNYLTYLQEQGIKKNSALYLQQLKIVSDLTTKTRAVDYKLNVETRKVEEERVILAKELANVLKNSVKDAAKFNKAMAKFLGPAAQVRQELKDFNDQMNEEFEREMKLMKASEAGYGNLSSVIEKHDKIVASYHETLKQGAGVYTDAEMALKKYEAQLKRNLELHSQNILNDDELKRAQAAAKAVYEEAIGLTEKRAEAEKKWLDQVKKQQNYLNSMAEANHPNQNQFRPQIENVLEGIREGFFAAPGGSDVLGLELKRIGDGLAVERQELLAELNKMTLTRISDPMQVYNAIQDSLTQQSDPMVKALRDQTREMIRQNTLTREQLKNVQNSNPYAVAAP